MPDPNLRLICLQMATELISSGHCGGDHDADGVIAFAQMLESHIRSAVEEGETERRAGMQ